MSAPSLPQQIHRYRILSELGRGSMGHVYLARDPNIERRIALKVLIPERMRGVGGEELRQRFLQEARAAGGLNHRGIVTIYDAGTDPESGCPYLAMEWVQGCSLRTLLRRDGPLTPERVVSMAAQVARALDYAHRQNIVHRDVKPANLLVVGDDHQPVGEQEESHPVGGHVESVKVVDFGIAKLMSKSFTQPGRVVGSPYYMSPEQVRGLAIDGRADLFGLGAVLYECLTGHAAFGGETVGNVTHNILTAEPKPRELYNSAVPPSLRAVVRRSLEKLPQDRYRSGAELAAALETVGTELALGYRRSNGPAFSGTTSTTTSRASIGGTTTEVMSDRARAGRLAVAPEARGGYEAKRLSGMTACDLEPNTGVDTGRQWPRLLVLTALVLVLGLLVGRAMDPKVLGVVEHGGGYDSGPTADSALPVVEVAQEEEIVDARVGGGIGNMAGKAAAESAEPVDPNATLPEAEAALADGFGALPPEPMMIDDEDVLGPVPESRLTAEEHVAGEGAFGELGSPDWAGSQGAVFDASSEPAGPAANNLEIIHENRLKLAYLSVFIDGRRTLSVKLETKNPLKRIKGREHRWLIPMPAGERLVEIRVSGQSKQLEARNKIWRVFSEEDPQRLTVNLRPDSQQLGFQWESR